MAARTPKFARIVVLYHDGMTVEVNGRYFDVTLTPMEVDEKAWADDAYYYARIFPWLVATHPEIVSKHEITDRASIEFRIQAGRDPGYRKYYEWLLKYYPELRPYLPV